MTFSLPRAILFASVGLPVGFVLTALGLTLAGHPIAAGPAFVGAVLLSVVAGAVGGFWRSRE